MCETTFQLDHFLGGCGFSSTTTTNNVGAPVGEPIKIWVEPVEYMKLEKQLGSRATFIQVKIDVNHFEQGILLVTPYTVDANQVVILPILEDENEIQKTSD